MQVDYFIKKNVDLLAQIDLNLSSGQVFEINSSSEKPYVNSASVKNTGWEFLMNYRKQVDGERELIENWIGFKGKRNCYGKDGFVDLLNSELFMYPCGKLYRTEIIRENSERIDYCIDFLMIAKYLERVGDHAVNICEWLEFNQTGSVNDQRLI